MKKRSRESITPDITPLIDIVFLLLIFFMVSSVFKSNELALLLNLPDSKSGTTEHKQLKTINIEVSKTEIAYQGQKISIPELNKKLTQVKDPTVPVELRIDKNVQYQRVVQVLDRLKTYQLSNIALITED